MQKTTWHIEIGAAQAFCFPGITLEALKQRSDVDDLEQWPLCSN